jgi:hypothetical protein
MEDILDSKHVLYPKALQELFKNMAQQISVNGEKYRVTEEIENSVSIDSSKFGKQKISALYSNLVDECKNIKLYASTVRACNRKWMDAGNVHESNVAANDYGFQNIKTKFVQEIRNCAMTYVEKLDITVKIRPEDQKNFERDLMAFLLAQQNVGREVAKMIGKEAYAEGFVRAAEFRYQYERFTDMLQYVQDNYFFADTIDFAKNDNFKECLIEAAKKCIRDFVDSKCIVVY